MATISIKSILTRIDALSTPERLTLERELSRRFQREWTAEVTKARRTARRRGIDQATIDLAVERHRYGK